MSLHLRSQRTLAHPAGCCGIGLHSGLIVNLEVRPLPPASGILFQRVDLPGRPTVAAAVRNVVSTVFATTLESRGVRVATVEHLLTALAGLGVVNALVQVDAPEVPILDGSRSPSSISCATRAWSSRRRCSRTCASCARWRSSSPGAPPVSIRRTAWTSPAGSPSPTRSSGSSRVSYRHDEIDFARGIGPARPFGLQRDVEVLLESGLARGGSTDNAVVLSEDGVLNEGGLRFRDEFAAQDPRPVCMIMLHSRMFVTGSDLSPYRSRQRNRMDKALLERTAVNWPDAFEPITRE